MTQVLPPQPPSLSAAPPCKIAPSAKVAPALPPQMPTGTKVQTFSMVEIASKHYIGTPRAAAILSAFMDFGDTEGDGEGPPLDFDDAMEALQAKQSPEAATSKMSAPADDGDSTRSTIASLDNSDDMHLANSADDQDDCDSEEEEYEDDFESDSEVSDDEEQLTETDKAIVSADTPHGGLSGLPRARSSSRSKGPRSHSKGALRSQSRGALRKKRSDSRSACTRS
mmetsp:Transcript_81633/g.141902  ORF Transcript_81633/g.141902 Transcript_81633/m.141902 type:complete len:225 (+) Transcript_81633:62-736(+)